MKRSILSIIMLSAISGGAVASERFDAVYGDPVAVIKVGTSFNDDGLNTKAVTASLQTKKCKKYRFCYNPFLMYTSTTTDVDDSYSTNAAIGVDAIYKVPKLSDDGFYVAIGAGAFMKPLHEDGNDRLNYHIGTGMEVSRVIVSVDAYGTDKKALVLFNVGYHFK